MPDSDPWSDALAADPATRRNGVPPSSSPIQTPASPSNGPPQQSPIGQAIVDTAAKLAGKSAVDVKPFLQQTGQSLDPTKMAWCAAFVNGVLGANGVQGTTGEGKNIATGFLNWGVPVQGEPQPGDVLVLPKGHPAGKHGRTRRHSHRTGRGRPWRHLLSHAVGQRERPGGLYLGAGQGRRGASRAATGADTQGQGPIMADRWSELGDKTGDKPASTTDARRHCRATRSAAPSTRDAGH